MHFKTFIYSDERWNTLKAGLGALLGDIFVDIIAPPFTVVTTRELTPQQRQL
jgi:hypothetical protein